MTYDEFVQRPQKLKARIEHKADKVEFLKALCEQTTTIFSDVKVQTSHGNRHETLLIDYIDSKQELGGLWDQYDEAVDDLQTWLYANMEFIDASMLEWRYCNGLKNSEIAEKMHYAEQTVKHRISRAVRLAEDKYYQQQVERG